MDRFICGEMLRLLARKGLLIPWSSPCLQLKTRFELHQDFNDILHLIQQDGSHWQPEFFTLVGIDSFKIHS